MSGGPRRRWGLHLAVGLAIVSSSILVVLWLLPDRSRPAWDRAWSGEASGRGPASSERGSGRAAGGGSARARPKRAPGRAQITGVLISPEDGPLSAGQVQLWCTDGRRTSGARLGPEGSFAAPACDGPEGTTCLRLIHPSYEQPEAWEFEPGASVELEVASAPGLVGRVQDPGGRPVPDALVILRRGAQVRSTNSDGEGEFSLVLPRARPCDACDVSEPGVEAGVGACAEAGRQPEGELRLLVQAPAFAPHERSLPKLEDRPTLEVELAAPAPALSGVVVDPSGRPFDARTRVLATSVERSDERHAAELDEAGRFRFTSLGGGMYALRVIRDGLEIATGEAAAGDSTRLRANDDADGDTLRLRIVDEEGLPRVGVRVDGGPLHAALSDRAGWVEAERVIPGRYTLRLRAPGCAAVRERVDFVAGEAIELELPAACEGAH